jgi:predicted DNA-binding protein (MmcQ/YjbR family)
VSKQHLLSRLRTLCLALARTTETLTWGHPTFKVAGKTFCVLEEYAGHLTMCFQLSPPDAEAALRDPLFFKAPYIGNRGWVSLIVDRPPDWKKVRELMLQSYALNAPRATRGRGAARKKRAR